MKRINLIISGKVQGVGFRYYTKRTAISLNLKGYVKNLTNNSVEVVAEGAEAEIKQFIEWCKKGPSSSHISDLKINYLPYTGEFKEFEIKH